MLFRETRIISCHKGCLYEKSSEFLRDSFSTNNFGLAFTLHNKVGTAVGYK